MNQAVAETTYELEEEGVFSQSSNASCKSQNEHDSSYHKEEPNWIKASQVSNRGDIGQHSLGKKQCQGITDMSGFLLCKSSHFVLPLNYRKITANEWSTALPQTTTIRILDSKIYKKMEVAFQCTVHIQTNSMEHEQSAFGEASFPRKSQEISHLMQLCSISLPGRQNSQRSGMMINLFLFLVLDNINILGYHGNFYTSKHSYKYYDLTRNTFHRTISPPLTTQSLYSKEIYTIVLR